MEYLAEMYLLYKVKKTQYHAYLESYKEAFIYLYLKTQSLEHHT